MSDLLLKKYSRYWSIFVSVVIGSVYKTKPIGRLVWQKGKIYCPIFRLADIEDVILLVLKKRSSGS